MILLLIRVRSRELQFPLAARASMEPLQGGGMERAVGEGGMVVYKWTGGRRQRRAASESSSCVGQESATKGRCLKLHSYVLGNPLG